MSFNHILSLTFVLFFIRLISFGICLPKNFDNLWQPGAFNSFSPLIYFFAFVFGIITLIIFIKKLGKTENKIKNSFFIYIVISYISLVLFNRIVIEGSTINYLFILNSSSSPFTAIKPYFVLDCFFEPPYIAWGLIILGIIYYICLKYNHIEYSIPFFIIPFCLFDFHFNDLIITSLMAYSVVGILGMIFQKKHSVFSLFFLFFFIFLSIILAYLMSKIDLLNLKLALETLFIFFIPSFIISNICYKSNDSNTSSLGWILPLFTLFFINMPLYRMPTDDCLIYFSSFFYLFSIIGNILIVVLAIGLITYISKKLFKIDNLVYYLLSICAVVFYILDSVLFYYSQFRINYQTIVWTTTMNDVTRTTLSTCSGTIIILSSFKTFIGITENSL